MILHTEWEYFLKNNYRKKCDLKFFIARDVVESNY